MRLHLSESDLIPAEDSTIEHESVTLMSDLVPAEDLNALHAEALRMDYKLDLANGLIPEAGGYMEVREVDTNESTREARTPITATESDRRYRSLCDNQVPILPRNLEELGYLERKKLLLRVVELFRPELEEILRHGVSDQDVHTGPDLKPVKIPPGMLSRIQRSDDLRLTREDEVDLRSVRIAGRRGSVHLSDWSATDGNKTLCGRKAVHLQGTSESVSCQRCLHSGELRGWKAVPMWRKRVSSFLGRFR